MFNKFGFVNVRLQYIADEVGISTGNLAYHFKTKDEIIEQLYTQFREVQQQLHADLRAVPIFVNIDYHIENTFELQKQYSFFYTDAIEVIRAYPSIKKAYREHIQWQAFQLEHMVQFNISRGALFLPEAPDSPSLLANRYLLCMEQWLNFERLKGQELSAIQSSSFKESIWGILTPYFTQAGKYEHSQLGSLPFDQMG